MPAITRAMPIIASMRQCTARKPPASRIIATPVTNSSVTAASTPTKKRRSTADMVRSRSGGSSVATAAGRTAKCRVAMPPTQKAAASRWMKSRKA